VVAESNTSQFRSWIDTAQPEDLLTIAPVLFSRIGTLEPRYQDRFIENVQRDPQAQRLFEKMQSPTR
jgi:hypothetical protein